MNLIDVLRQECITTEVKPADKKEAVAAMAELACKSPLLSGTSKDDVEKALLEREQVGSTGFGMGLAIPHCRLKGLTDFVVGVMCVPDGVDFDALDDQPVKLFVFIIVPDDESNNHIRLLSSISQVFRIEGAMDEISKAQSPEAVRESLLRHQRDELDATGRQEQCMFHVFVQNEELFEDILQVFSAYNHGGVMVIDSQASRSYLSRMPLFAGFLSDSARGFNRIIIAQVEKRLANDTIRQIEQVTGKIDDRDDIMLTVQEVFYSSGRLEP